MRFRTGGQIERPREMRAGEPTVGRSDPFALDRALDRLLLEGLIVRPDEAFDRGDVAENRLAGLVHPAPHTRRRLRPRAPAHVWREQRGIEQHDRGAGAKRRAKPEAAVDDEVGVPAIARRHELLNGRGDGGVLAPYAGAIEATVEGFSKKGAHKTYDLAACVTAVRSVGFVNTLAIDYTGAADPVANIEMARDILQAAIDANPE